MTDTERLLVTKQDCFDAGLKAGKLDLVMLIKRLIKDGYELDYIDVYLSAYSDALNE